MVYTRKNQNQLTSTEKRKFVDAVLALKKSGQYDAFVRTHIDYYVSDGEAGLRVAHMTPSFLPWHRRFLLDFETALRSVDEDVTVPYWDWTVDRTMSSSLWGDDFLGGNGRDGDRQVTTGPFAYSTGEWTIKETVTDVDFLVRDFGDPGDPVELPTKEELAGATSDPVYDMEPWDSTATGGFRNKLEGWVNASGKEQWSTHNLVHRWVGGHMLGGASVNDPVFWLHHAFVDLIWSRWRQDHPGAVYLPADQPGSGSGQHGRIVARNEPLPPWDVTPGSLDEHSSIYRYA